MYNILLLTLCAIILNFRDNLQRNLKWRMDKNVKMKKNSQDIRKVYYRLDYCACTAYVELVASESGVSFNSERRCVTLEDFFYI
jgi:hypothetical protein